MAVMGGLYLYLLSQVSWNKVQIHCSIQRRNGNLQIIPNSNGTEHRHREFSRKACSREDNPLDQSDLEEGQ